MTKSAPIISANIALVRRSLKVTNRPISSQLFARGIVFFIFFECLFFKGYLNELIKAIDLNNQENSLNDLQNSLQTNQALVLPLSLGKDALSVLILALGLYLLFEYRNKYLLMKTIKKEDNATKLYLGIEPKYIVREMLLINFFSCLESGLIALILSLLLSKPLLGNFNEFFPYQISLPSQYSIFLSLVWALLLLIVALLLLSRLFEVITVHKIKSSGTLE